MSTALASDTVICQQRVNYATLSLKSVVHDRLTMVPVRCTMFNDQNTV